MERKLAAILAADVVGYSRLIAEDEARTLDALRALRRESFEPLVAEHRGEVVKRMGDGWLVSFASVVDAAQCAIQVQERLSGDDRIKLRIGVHLGDIVHEDEDIYGDGVNIAARLQEVAESGGVLISGTAYESLVGRLDDRFEDAGEQSLKSISRSVRAWRWVIADTLVPQSNELLHLAPALPDKPSIVVLPFENRSGDPEQDHIADGITEDAITDLSRFRELFVIGHNTSFSLKGSTLSTEEVARELGVHFVLSGSVRKSGNRVRVTAQLIDSIDGAQVWTERYDDLLEDVFDLQQRITEQVVGSIAHEIVAAEVRHVEQGNRRFSPADDLAWRAQKKFNDVMGAVDGFNALADAVELAQQAVDTDPASARGWAILSIARMFQVFSGVAEDREFALDEADRAAARLMALEPYDARSFRARGLAGSLREDWIAALADLRKAYEINPNDSIVIQLAFTEARAGNTTRASELADKAIRINPRSRIVGTAYLAKATCAFIDDDMEALHKWAELAIQAQPIAPMRRVLMAVYAARTGNEALKAQQIDALKASAPKFVTNILSGAYRPFHETAHIEKLISSLRDGGIAEAFE